MNTMPTFCLRSPTPILVPNLANLHGWKKNIGLTDTTRIHLMTKRSHKQIYSIINGVPNILIDDYEKNINEWKESGGTGILHTCATETIQLLHELGFRSTANIDGDSFA